MKKQYPNGKWADPQPVNQVLRWGQLGQIIKHAQKNIAAEQLIKNLLPNHLAKHCKVLNIHDDILILEIDNAGLAMNLRYNQTELLTKLQQSLHFKSLKKIEFKVRPAINLGACKKKEVPVLSNQSRTIINQCAEGMTNPEVKAALLRMIRSSL